MFEQTFVEGTVKTKTPFTVMGSFIFQCVLVGVAILVPLIYTDTLPTAQLTSFLVAPPPPPPHLRRRKRRRSSRRFGPSRASSTPAG